MECRNSCLERITALSFSVYHLHYFFVYFLAISISLCPVVSCSAAVFGHEYVFWVVKVCVRRCKYVVDNTRLEVDEYSTWNVVFIVCLVEEDILAIAAFCCPFFENSLFVYPMFCTQSLPVYRTHYEHPRNDAASLSVRNAMRKERCLL